MRKSRKRIESDVRRYALDHGLLRPGENVLVAVSGGPDSSALLLVLHRLAKGLRLRLTMAHFDHKLRGPEASESEAAHVQRLAASLELPLVSGAADVRAMARRERLSLEDAARRARYAFLACAAGESGCTAVAAGHTASDQAETVLQHIVRGAGLTGLAAMAATSPWPYPGHPGLRLVRPLLRLSREETLAYCRAAGVEPLQDPSNVSAEFQRNRVRNEVMPLLRQLNAGVENALARLAEAAAEDLAFIQSEVAQALEVALSRDQAGSQTRVALPRAAASAVPASARLHALRLGIAAVLGDTEGFSERHLTALARLLMEGKTGDRLDLPRSLIAVLRRHDLELRRRRSEAALPAQPAVLPVPGEVRFGHLLAAAGTDAGPGSAVECDAAAAGGVLCVRRRRPGDRFQPLGLSKPKKLQDFFVDAHVSRDERDNVPLFVSERGIVWVGGLRLAEWARPRAGEPTVYLSISSED